MFCKYCGKEISDDSIFCNYCGKNVTESNNIEQASSLEAYSQETDSEYNDDDSDSDSNSHKVLWTIIIIAALLLIMFITCPNEAAHKSKICSMIQNEYAKEFSDKENGNTWEQLGYAFGGAMVTTLVNSMVSVDNYGIFSIGIMHVDGKSNKVSLGILGHVFIPSINKKSISDTIQEDENSEGDDDDVNDNAYNNDNSGHESNVTYDDNQDYDFSSEYNTSSEEQSNEDGTQLCEDLTQQWIQAHNNEDYDLFEQLYADKVYYYTEVCSRNACIKSKRENLKPSVTRYVTDMNSYSNDNGQIVVHFIKGHLKNGNKKEYDSYLVFENMNGEYRIVREGDEITDRNSEQSTP